MSRFALNQIIASVYDLFGNHWITESLPIFIEWIDEWMGGGWVDRKEGGLDRWRREEEIEG